jgi:hypothetical protein
MPRLEWNSGPAKRCTGFMKVSPGASCLGVQESAPQQTSSARVITPWGRELAIQGWLIMRRIHLREDSS